MKAGLNLNQVNVQTLTMTPQLQQAIRLLQLSTIDLQHEIQENLDKNPFLEMEENDSGSSNVTSLDEIREKEYRLENGNDDITPFNNDTTVSLDNAPYADGGGENDYTPLKGEDGGDNSISREDGSTMTDSGGEVDFWQESYSAGVSSRRTHNSDGDDLDDYQGATGYGLAEHLSWQLNLTPMSDSDHLIAEAILDGINESGYLTESLDDIISAVMPEFPEVTMADVERVLNVVQHFDPVGIASRSLQESLLIQLSQFDNDDNVRLARVIVSDYLELLGKKDFRTLAKNLDIKEKNSHLLKDAIDIITRLEPRPGNCIPQEKSEYVIPDVSVHKKDGVWIAELNPNAIPKIKLNETYCQLCSNVRNPQENQYIRNHMQEAHSFIQSVNKRNETLYRVASCIVQHQQDFFEHGEQFMKPLVLNDIAMETGLHESTISRVTTEKYIHTPRGTFELKYFFSSHVSSTDSSDEFSSTAIRAKIKKLISEENQKKPLSDSQLAKILENEGIQVARRTIAKYRESLNIPPSSQRKVI
ncbi:MAG: RNA polymerase factor sigma-54 [Ruminobacter sp.]|uniref:RNA polymerase factor sigma-54 n=1 Tax=Ruminobacter sp. TaxID=2774296 RepID=UPI001B5C9F27|nr:RNA polymerase factor sigma-54 [Ruminobacter sp.]MBP3749575.1 RNA polymerase factor sigma-54 [Ruminobacter sp.]